MTVYPDRPPVLHRKLFWAKKASSILNGFPHVFYMIRTPPLSLSLSLSLVRTHTRARIYTHTHAHTKGVMKITQDMTIPDWVLLSLFMSGRVHATLVTPITDFPVYILNNREWGHRTQTTRKYGPQHDKTNKMTSRPAKTQSSLDIRPGWSESWRTRHLVGFVMRRLNCHLHFDEVWGGL